MSDEEKLADQTGKFVQVVVDGRKRNDVDWVPGRILLSNKRLVLASSEGKRTVPLSDVTGVKAGSSTTQAIAKVTGYLSVQAGADVTLIAPDDLAAFEAALFGALLNGSTVLVKHPAVEGGVVQETDWQKGRLTVEAETVNLALTTGTFVELDVGEVSTVERAEKSVRGSTRQVVEVGHVVGTTSVETHVSGTGQTVAVLETFARRGETAEVENVELTDAETEVLMALYTGVSPFQIADFVGMDVEEVEEIYDSLVEKGLLEGVRTRRAVELEARGRSIASDAMSDQ